MEKSFTLFKEIFSENKRGNALTYSMKVSIKRYMRKNCPRKILVCHRTSKLKIGKEVWHMGKNMGVKILLGLLKIFLYMKNNSKIIYDKYQDEHLFSVFAFLLIFYGETVRYIL